MPLTLLERGNRLGGIFDERLDRQGTAYGIHAMAPDPLPENAMWWIEIENPDGSKGLGAATPIME